MKILITGGSGVLGTELQKHIKCMTPSRSYLDITKPTVFDALGPIPTLIVHCAAYTDVLKAETEKELCYKTNVIGTRNVASLCIPMLYISTEYVFSGEKGNYAEEDYPAPVNFYGLTKLLGEYESLRRNGKVIRTLFKPRPFKHDAALTDQFTTGDYVEKIAVEIAKCVRYFSALPEIIHIGSDRKSTYDLARQTKPDISKITLADIKGVRLPADTSLNCSKWKELKCRLNLQ